MSEQTDVQQGGASITTPLTELLGVVCPILLAPMGGVAGGRLAAAVSEAGGFGIVGGGYGHREELERELAAAGTARVGIGFITFALDERRDSLRFALERRPVAVQLSFGDPAPYVDDIRAAGALLISQVQTVDEGRRAVAVGADVVIVQGQDSGGHGRPGRGTIGLVPATVDALAGVPVVAAGGLADGRGLAAALMLGASGISLGTRLYASAEATSDAAARARLVASTGDDTVRTEAFDVLRGPAWPAPYDGRVVRNRISDEWDPDSDDARRAELRAALRGAAADDYGVKPLWAGEGLDLIDAIEPAAAILRSIVSTAAKLLAAAPGLLDNR